MSCIASLPNDAQWTLASDMRAVLADGSMSDVDLVGNDGGRVSASRFVLGARSRVFRRMFFGTFMESSSNEIHLDYHSSVLSVLVEFCYTDEVLLFRGSKNSNDEERARVMVRVFSAAHYFELLSLEVGVTKMIEMILDRSKPLACAVFDETCGQGPDAYKLRSLAIETIRSYPEQSMLSETTMSSPGVAMLGSEAISDLMHDGKIRAEELTIFSVLRKWTKVGQKGSMTLTEKEETARGYAAMINLLHIPPSELVGAVKDSELVSRESIISALKQQSLMAEKATVIEREQFRQTVLFAKEVTLFRAPKDPMEKFTVTNAGNGGDEAFIERALHAERRGFPFTGCRSPPINTLGQVVIEGAGCEEVNGTYFEDGTFGGLPKYCKKGEWQGRDTNFVIYCWRSKVWYIAEVSTFGSLGKESNDLYLSDSSGRDLLPESMW
eukprot:CAMPEP_0113528104 /NCGR_PEP_ID=MMETSP0015_2-20120614/1657_1 /TAXON_ID=2838 /ORGANISM="Odontella" /LENGTH=438 /DNA_ID=CAMNT_0000426595 /DNA_START=167 /DNA_END=1480 /DNA_ORIENTATION=- /assembly_acc=CAM_ASM_000160